MEICFALGNSLRCIVMRFTFIEKSSDLFACNSGSSSALEIL